MSKPLHKMSLDGLIQMRDAVLAANPEEDGKVKMGEMFSGKITMRAERAAVLAQLDEAIAHHEATGSETTQ